MAPLTFPNTYNMVAFLSKSDASEGFDQIVDFLNAHTIQYALVVNPTIYVSCKDVIRRDLHLDDADGVECLPNEEIFVELARMGYEKPPPKLTCYKAIVRNVDSPRNFFMYPHFLQVVMDNQVDDITSHNTRYTSPALTQKMFANMRKVRKGFSGVETHLFASMMVQPQPQAEEEVEVPIAPAPPSHTRTTNYTSESSMSLLTTLMETCASLSQKVAELEQDKHTQSLEILKLKKRVKKLEKKKRSKHLGFKRLRRVGTFHKVESSVDIVVEKNEEVVAMDAEPQGRLDHEEVNTTSKGISAAEPTIFDTEEAYIWREYKKVQTMFKPDKDVEELKKKRVTVKEKFSSAVPSVDKEKALWVELKRLFEPDADDVLWKLQRYMHYLLIWKLYTNCGVHQVSSTTRRHDMFMVTEKEYPLSNVVMILMLSGKLQVEEDNEMARHLVMKIFMEANKPKSKSLDTSSK
uniref:Synaptobrevin, longin-like domain protein n=1 Tax=Tanacetum cinerariifolium TaxID=118510 RepID=A0A699I5A3_TANCI|nr:hypothetical protein [Tanacetum cinerariifolium]